MNLENLNNQLAEAIANMDGWRIQDLCRQITEAEKEIEDTLMEALAPILF